MGKYQTRYGSVPLLEAKLMNLETRRRCRQLMHSSPSRIVPSFLEGPKRPTVWIEYKSGHAAESDWDLHTPKNRRNWHAKHVGNSATIISGLKCKTTED